MNPNDHRPEQAAELRKRAEKIAVKKTARSSEDLEALSPEETRKMLHELRVHQIELEMQNDELRRRQAELDVTRARYFDLYDLAPVGYVTVNRKGLILEANLTAANLLGVARSTMIKQPLSVFILKEDQNIYYLHRKQLVETGASQSCELRMLRPDNAAVWMRLEANATQGKSGTPLYRVVISDLTGRKRMEEERDKLETQNRQLLKAESLTRMAGAIAHHFNNQLMVIMGNLDLVMGDLPRGARQLEKLTQAMDATLRAGEMSSLMLTYLGQTTAQKEPMDICEANHRILPLIRTALPEIIHLETDLPPTGRTINGNANQIQQLLIHLITNARESVTDDRGIITLTLKTVSSGDIPGLHRYPIDWQPQDTDYACLEVRDTGCGIAEKDIEKIFDPFFTSKFIGRGLGLAVVLGILRVHMGAITVESELGRGSIFRAYLPHNSQIVATHSQQVLASLKKAAADALERERKQGYRGQGADRAKASFGPSDAGLPKRRSKSGIPPLAVSGSRSVPSRSA